MASRGDAMCGIAGIRISQDKNIDKNIPIRMQESIRHRGPDDKGIFVDEENKVYLIHTRLSIIDLSRKAHQPMKDGKDRYVIVYNGEIYNFKDIRKELEAKGYKFFSNSDTEVILKAYQEWGQDCLEKLRGMYAFCIWNKVEKELFLARDRFGIKPLYYYHNKDIFIFASEIKAISISGLVKPEIDFEAVGLFLSLGYIPSPKTIYKNIFSLEPGHFLRIFQNKIKKMRYYNHERIWSKDHLKISKEEAIQCTKRELFKSIEYHLVADVKIGAFLSGGIDSSSIVSLMRQVGHRKIKSVSVVFPGTIYDESRYSSLVSKRFKAEGIQVEIKGRDLLDNLEKIFYTMDQPTIDGINTYFISLAAKKAGLKVILSGLGGDELFGGYPSFKEVPGVYGQSRGKGGKILLAMKDVSFVTRYLAYRGLYTKSQISEILSPGLAEEVLENLDLRRFYNLQMSSFIDDFSKVSFLETNFYMSEQLLRDTDIFSMAHSLEIRVPFVDHKLVEFINRIRTEYKTDKIPKKLLVTAVGDLPKPIYNRPKMGFILPFDIWLKNELRPVLLDELSNSKIFNKAYIQKSMTEFDSHKLHWPRIWALFVLVYFIKKLCD